MKNAGRRVETADQARCSALYGMVAKRTVACATACGLLAMLGGCGLSVASPDLFVLTRTGHGAKLTLLVNDAGTIRCNGSAAKAIPDSMLLSARSLVTQLTPDAQRNLTVAPGRGSVYAFTVRLSVGTITFGDTAAGRRAELAQAELFALQAAHGPCGLRSA
jgi:hypothetical protein